MKNRLLSSLLALSCFVLFACEELPTTPDETTGSSASAKPAGISFTDVPTIRAKLAGDSSKTWKLIERVENNVRVDVSGTCFKDDQITIQLDQKIIFDVGLTPCIAENNLAIKSQTGIWQLTDRPSLLIQVIDQPPFEVRFPTLDDQNLVLSFRDAGDVDILETYVVIDTASPDLAALKPGA